MILGAIMTACSGDFANGAETKNEADVLEQ